MVRETQFNHSYSPIFIHGLSCAYRRMLRQAVAMHHCGAETGEAESERDLGTVCKGYRMAMATR